MLLVIYYAEMQVGRCNDLYLCLILCLDLEYTEPPLSEEDLFEFLNLINDDDE